ncbi:C-C motif chemokine 4-like isoform X2 [Lampris incognitus]|uniref:C-C motif chemokine 4-like isoform X2 n=1 Tax=Lampris incognitus TaxID=2546036 RepID=UPI0024B5C0F9|nr:C-C motif chemokine 4-like isoform X2 [Lampris incognitus]
MTKLCLALGLLLLAACNAQRGSNTVKPENCCFKFSTMRIPIHKIVTIKETGIHCQEEGFIVHTVQGKQICVRRHEEWVQDAFN